jgi:hypothetical protein
MKYPVVQQHSQEDCGAACLATVAKHYGRIFSINHIREAVGTGQLGTTMLGLKQGAEALSFYSRGVKAALEIVDRGELPLPALVKFTLVFVNPLFRGMVGCVGGSSGKIGEKGFFKSNGLLVANPSDRIVDNPNSPRPAKC